MHTNLGSDMGKAGKDSRKDRRKKTNHNTLLELLLPCEGITESLPEVDCRKVVSVGRLILLKDEL